MTEEKIVSMEEELKENTPTIEELGISVEEGLQELKDNKEKSKSELIKKIGKFVSEYKNFKELTLANRILHVVVPVIILILVFSMSNGSGVDLSNFISTYNELSQESFEEYGITGWDEIEGDDLQEVQAEASLFINPSEITTYGYLYEGMVSNPGLLMLYADESDMVLGYTFLMSTEYIAGNDSFSNVVLESLMKSFDDLSDDEIYEIKSNFSMQDSLIGVVTRDAYGRYEYNGITYVVTMSESGLNFSAYLSDEYAN